jgi:hypothetical protein
MYLAIDPMRVPQWCRGMAGGMVAAFPHILDCAVCYLFHFVYLLLFLVLLQL